MDKKPIPYNYNGEIIDIYPGNSFTKYELILRLKEMNFAFVDSSYEKQDLITLYDIATSYRNNIEKIIYKLRKDKEMMKYRENFPKELNKENDNNINIFHNFAKKLLFRDNQNQKIYPNNNVNNNNSKRSDNAPSSNEVSSSLGSKICKKILKLIYNNKKEIMKLIFFATLYYCVNYFVERISNRMFVFGFILKKIWSQITPKRLILLYLGYTIFSYIINSLLFSLFGIGIVGLLYLIFNDKLVELFKSINMFS